VPLLLVAGLYTKNYVKFGTFGPTSCVGLSVARVTTYQLDHDDIERLIASGKLSPLAATSAFLLPAVYPDLFAHEKPTGVAALDRVMKSNRTTNVNNVAYLGICRQYTSDGMVALREHPGRFVNAVAVGNLIFLRPSSDYLLFSAQNKSAVQPVERPFSVALGQFARDDALVPGLSDGVTTVAWFVLAAYLAAVIVGVRRVRRRRGDPPAAPELAVTVFVLVCIAYVATVGNLLESGENNRFRFVLDGLVVCLLASEWWKRRRSRATEAHGTQRVESSVSSTR
jgi:hypothetical protein